MAKEPASIFREFYTEKTFIDRFLMEGGKGYDVIIPIVHTNEFWRSNLISYYSQIPVNRLLIGNGGCIDGSIEIAREFPRVEVLDHREVVSIGYSLRKLIEAVETEWFIYLHSDVYLPEGWMDGMKKHTDEYDWIESSHHITVMLDYELPYRDIPVRPFSGGQMGRSDVLRTVAQRIDDDFLVQTEDIVIASLVQQASFRYGRVHDVFLHHQLMNRTSPLKKRIKYISQFQYEWDPEDEMRTYIRAVRGIIKYMPPENGFYVQMAQSCLAGLARMAKIHASEFREWVARVNPAWTPVLFDTDGSLKQPAGLPQKQEPPEDINSSAAGLARAIERTLSGNTPGGKINWEVITALENKLAELKRRMVISR